MSENRKLVAFDINSNLYKRIVKYKDDIGFKTLTSTIQHLCITQLDGIDNKKDSKENKINELT